jgi:hypothetical protein
VSDIEAKDEPVILSSERIEGRGGLTVDVVQGYKPPLDGTSDDYAAIDQQTSRYVAEILVKTYFGYGWCVTAETRQGVIMFRIPDLMGASLQYVINLAKFSDLTKDLIVRCGGELLEMMNLPRGAVDMALLAEARKNMHKFDFRSAEKRRA